MFPGSRPPPAPLPGSLQRELGRKRSLGACRLLFEIGPQGVEVRQLRARLGLDSGYTSRLLRQLEREGLIGVTASRADARVRLVRLTAAGRKEVEVLNRLSDESAARILEPLSEPQRAELLAAMATVERLLRSSAVQLAVVDPDSAAARSCLQQYYRELAARFEGGFDPARALLVTEDDFRPPRGYLVLATLYGEPVGTGSLVCHADWGEIKRVWVAPSVRGLGVGTRILQRLEALARQRGLPRLRLDTNKALREAHVLYRRHGYREIPSFNENPYAHLWFEKALR